jgi:hypothetical protein
MSVYGNRRFAKRVNHYARCCLSADARKRNEFFEIIRNMPFVHFHQKLRNADDAARFRLVKPGPPDHLLHFSHGRIRKRRTIGINFEKLARNNFGCFIATARA